MRYTNQCVRGQQVGQLQRSDGRRCADAPEWKRILQHQSSVLPDDPGENGRGEQRHTGLRLFEIRRFLQSAAVGFAVDALKTGDRLRDDKQPPATHNWLLDLRKGAALAEPPLQTAYNDS